MKRCLILFFSVGLSAVASAQTCSSFPCIVATVTLMDQSAAIPNTPIFTPSANGIFRITAYLSTTASTNKGARWSILTGWTDENGFRYGYGDAFSGGSDANTATSVARDLAGQPLLYSTRLYQTGGTPMTYNLFITVEQLQ